ncbi:hypothetical protein D3C76_858230 [compost metagenome]
MSAPAKPKIFSENKKKVKDNIRAITNPEANPKVAYSSALSLLFAPIFLATKEVIPIDIPEAISMLEKVEIISEPRPTVLTARFPPYLPTIMVSKTHIIM